jgi:geranylgeranyl diphosphate synthase type II
MDIKKLIALRASAVDKELSLRIARVPACHPRLREAMLYSMAAGGKRLRPVLLTVVYELFGGNWRKVLPAACALEMVHTYSLIHDDLPAMDDDSLRRGRPTSHVVFGEAMAILAGDALLTDAFSVLYENAGIKGVNVRGVLQAAGILARRAGAAGMVSGQAADLEAEGFLRGGTRKCGNVSRRPPLPRACEPLKAARLLTYIHKHKTADLIMASVEMGAALGGAKPSDFKTLSDFARTIGLCFRIIDDVLDVVGDKRKLGKSGSDARNAKLTYASLYGIERSKKRAAALLALACKKLKALPYPPGRLKVLADIAGFVYSRER